VDNGRKGALSIERLNGGISLERIATSNDVDASPRVGGDRKRRLSSRFKDQRKKRRKGAKASLAVPRRRWNSDKKKRPKEIGNGQNRFPKTGKVPTHAVLRATIEAFRCRHAQNEKVKNWAPNLARWLAELRVSFRKEASPGVANVSHAVPQAKRSEGAELRPCGGKKRFGKKEEGASIKPSPIKQQKLFRKTGSISDTRTTALER